MFTTTKSPLASRAVWGGIVSIAGAGLGALGYTLSPEDATALPILIASVASGLGGIGAIVGRVRASKKVSFSG